VNLKKKKKTTTGNTLATLQTEFFIDMQNLANCFHDYSLLLERKKKADFVKGV
jgi:hypothetical protein